MCIGIYLSMHECRVCVYLYRCMYVGIRVCVRMHVWVLSVYLCLYVCVGCVLQCFRPVRWDPNPATGDPYPIRIRARCEPDTQAIRRPTHEIIHRSVSVHAVKTRQQFGSKIASFHVSVCSCVFTVIGIHLHVTLIISCDFLLCFTNLITCTISWDIINCSP